MRLGVVSKGTFSGWVGVNEGHYVAMLGPHPRCGKQKGESLEILRQD